MIKEELTLRVTDLETKAIAFCREKDVPYPITKYLVAFATEVTKELQKENAENESEARELNIRFDRLIKENAELKNKLEHRNCLDCSNHSSKLRMRKLELEKENAELRKTETMLKVLKDRGVIKSWYYNGSYHIGNELPR